MISDFFRRVLAASSATIFLFCLLANQTATAQASTFDGYWFPIFHEDNLERGQGPPAGDYTGIPLNDAGRLRAVLEDAGDVGDACHGAGSAMRQPPRRTRLAS